MTADTRSPYVFDTHDLGRRPGAMRELERSFGLPEALGSDIMSIPTGSTLGLQLRFEAVMEGVLVTGHAQGTALGECGRCLDPLTRAVDVAFQQLYAYEDRAEAIDDEDDDVSLMDGDLLDVTGPVTDAVVLDLPFQPLCSQDCLGLCPQSGERLADVPEQHHDNVDPRWAALEQLITGDGDREEK